MSDREAKIRERAYQLWIEQGQPEGRSDQHWEEARRLVDAEGGDEAGPGAVGPAADAAATKARARRKTAG
jgi:hypothetical protein